MMLVTPIKLYFIVDTLTSLENVLYNIYQVTVRLAQRILFGTIEFLECLESR